MSRNKHKSQDKKAVIDIVVTFAGRFDMLEKCLDRLYAESQTIPLSIYIMDIDSPSEERIQNDELFRYQETKDANKNVVDFKTKRFTTNVGYPMGANDGARMGKAPLVMILNDDVELQSGAISEVVQTFVDETVGIVGLKLIFPNTARPNYPAGKIQHVGLALNIRGEPTHPLVGWSPSNPRTQVSRDVWAVTGACLTIRRDLFNRIGGFDLVYGRGTFEDADICLKVRQQGKRVYLNSRTYGTHYTGASQEKRKEGFPLQRNLQIFHSKWSETGLMVYDDWTYF